MWRCVYLHLPYDIRKGELRNPNLDCHCEGEARSNPGCMALFLDCFAEPVQSDSEVLAMTEQTQSASFIIHSGNDALLLAVGRSLEATLRSLGLTVICLRYKLPLFSY